MSVSKMSTDKCPIKNFIPRMRTALLFSLVMILIIPDVSGQVIEEREKQSAARNHIKTKTQIDFNYQTGTVSKNGNKTSVTLYSQAGDILQKSFLDPKGQVIGSERYEYDDDNNRILFEREGSGSVYKKTSGYDSRNHLVLETGFNGTENFRNEFRYNSSGKLTEASYFINNRLQQRLIYENSGNISNVDIYTAGTTLSSKMRMVYNSQEQITEETTSGIDGKELEKKVYKYNLSSQLLEESKTVKGVLHYRITYSYDNRGNLLSVHEETPARAKYAKKMYSFDSAGNLIEYKWRRSPDEEFNVKSYTYDTKGICLSEHTFYPKTKYELLSRFQYEFY